ncbi:hypothetical protein ACFVH6_26855 [Spirillospora sp. NPDC127200]
MRCPACGSDTGTGAPRCARCNALLPVPDSERPPAPTGSDTDPRTRHDDPAGTPRPEPAPVGGPAAPPTSAPEPPAETAAETSTDPTDRPTAEPADPSPADTAAKTTADTPAASTAAPPDGPAPVTEHVTILDPQADAALTQTTEFAPPPARSAALGRRARRLLVGPAGWAVAGVLAVALAGALIALWPNNSGTSRPAGAARPTGPPGGADPSGASSGAASGPRTSASPSALTTVGERFWVDTFKETEGFARPDSSSGVVGVLDAGRNWVLCRRWGSREQRTDAQGRTHHNHWWLLTNIDRYYGDGGHNPRTWVSALYLSKWGDDEAKDNDGRDIPECPPGDLRTTD